MKHEKQKFRQLLRSVFQAAVNHDKFAALYAAAIGRNKSTVYRRLESPTTEDMAMLELLEKIPIEQWPERWEHIALLIKTPE